MIIDKTTAKEIDDSMTQLLLFLDRMTPIEQLSYILSKILTTSFDPKLQSFQRHNELIGLLESVKMGLHLRYEISNSKK